MFLPVRPIDHLDFDYDGVRARIVITPGQRDMAVVTITCHGVELAQAKGVLAASHGRDGRGLVWASGDVGLLMETAYLAALLNATGDAVAPMHAAVEHHTARINRALAEMLPASVVPFDETVDD